MNEAQEIHRDIYSGIVAEELAKNGYYGEDLTLYGFAESANGGRGVQLFTDEEECAVTYLKRRAVGALLSPIETIHRRSDGGDAAYKTLKDEFCVQLADSVLAGRGPKVDLTPFWDYVNDLSPEQRKEKALALVGVLTLPFDMATATRTALRTLKQPQNDGNRCYYGFFVRKDDRWQSVTNGSLPALLKKWRAQDHPVTPLLKMTMESRAPIYALKDDFEKELRTIMDDGYLHMIHTLYQNTKNS